LEGLGWLILRIWSTDWWTNAARETDRLHVALQAALAEARAKRNSAKLPVADHVIIETEDEVPELAMEDSIPPAAEAALGDGQIEEANADPARFYEDDYRPTLSAMVESELANAGPLRQDRLVQRIARLHGFQRAGHEIQERVVASVPRACKQTHDSAGTFVWPTGADPAAYGTFRRPAVGESRDSMEIPIEELTALAKACQLEHQGDDAVLIAMRDACGLLKLRESSRQRFREAMAITAGTASPF
jgi:hypothetical protein